MASRPADPSVSHRVALADGWTVWKWAQLRAPGFRASLVTELAAPAAARAADAIASGRADIVRLHAAAVVESRAAGGRAGDKHASKELRNIAGLLQRGDWSSLSIPGEATAGSAMGSLRAAIERVRSRDGELEYLLEAESRRVSGLLRALAGDRRFREAVLWQNRGALHSSLDGLLRSVSERNDSRQRQRERLIACYLQRYATKNETIGFFGPVAWAAIRDDPSQAVTMRSRPDALVQRRVYFEHWAIDAVAQAFAREPAIVPHLAPRRMPTIRLEGTTLVRGGHREELPEAYAAVLAACDGNTPALSVADAVMAIEALELSDAVEVFGMLEQLAEKRLIMWTLEIPVGLVPARPELALRALVERIPAADVRDIFLAKLDLLFSLRAEIERAGGDPERLDRAMDALAAAFEQLTGLDAVRNQGKAYAGRTLVYEECVGDMSADIAAGVFRVAAPALSLVFQSARWFTAELAARYRALATEIFDRLRGQADRVDYVRFWEEMVPHVTTVDGKEPPMVRAVAAELRARWTRILFRGKADDARAINLSPEDIAAAVADVFAADRPGWHLARFLAPDVMIAAASTEAIARGRFELVLGELHVAVNSLFYVGQRADPRPLYDAVAADLPETTLSPTESKDHVTRVDYPPLKPGDFQFEIGPSRSSFPRSRVMAGAELEVVSAADGSLNVASRDGRHTFDLLDVLGNYLSFVAGSSFKILTSAPHVPRVTIGRLIVERERWLFEPKQLTFAFAKERTERFVSARQWVLEHGIPRFVFVKTPEEPKPIYIDLESPILVDVLAGCVRQASTVSVSEMLPDLEQLWLRDPANGDAFTSELRLAVVDPTASRLSQRP